MALAGPLPIDYRDLGRMLKDTREAFGIPLDEISGTLHIRTPFLQALEKGEFTAIPGEVYVRGYMKRYADYLGYDAASLLGQVRKEPPKLAIAARYLPPDRSNRKHSTLGVILLFGLSLGTVAALDLRRQEVAAPPLVEPMPERFLPLLNLGTPRLAEAPPPPGDCRELAGAAALLCADREIVLARLLTDTTLPATLLTLPQESPFWPEADAAAEVADGGEEAQTPSEAIDSLLASPDQPAVASPRAPKYQEPLWMNPFRE